MAIKYEETKSLIGLVLRAARMNALEILQSALDENGWTMPEFYDGVIEHAIGLPYTSDQWLDFHQKVPHWRLRDEKALMDKLSPRQREQL